VLERVVAGHGSTDPNDIGRVVFLGEGLEYQAYGATCLLGAREVALVVRIPHDGSGDEQLAAARREKRLLEQLAQLDLPLRLPVPVAEGPVPTGLAVVQEWVRGVPCDLRAPRTAAAPWELVAEAAAVIHGVDPAPLRALLPGPTTCREDALAGLERLRDLDLPEARAALAWACANLPPDEPSRLLHGDLLGQNLLQAPDEPLGVIDWGLARLGDPASDLAIVTRGVRRPFQTERGLERLLEAYERRSGESISASRVHLYELVLCAGFYRADAKEYGVDSPAADQARAKLFSVLERAVRSTGR
jgi:aminoglycoside phosphotransferase (APT) family kinase protein